MNEITLSIAIGDYDHVRDLIYGNVVPDGIKLVVAKRTPVEEIFYRFTMFREWDVSEMSFAKYVSLRSQPDCDLIAIPVFPSRSFRHSSIYVRADSDFQNPSDLKGGRIGVPEWAQTASIYTRGMLSHDYGVPLTSVRWIQAGVNEPGRKEKVKISLPKGVSYTPLVERSLSDMLCKNEIDAIFSARPPKPMTDRTGELRRIFNDSQSEELAYWRRTGIFPIMHVIALKSGLVEKYPWIAMNLMQAFDEAKNMSLARIKDLTASSVPLPWVTNMASLSESILGGDIWPYGIEGNRPTLKAFLQYAYEQGVCHRQLEIEELFVPSTLSKVKV
jgi:4,5-dihydroxyphthalate decarboxylase